MVPTDVATHYAQHGVNLVEAGGGWSFRTAPDLADPASHLRDALRAQAIDAEVSEIEPNLEDVFVSATHRQVEARAA